MMLSTVYGNLGETRRSEEHATRAFEHRGKVSERERLGITYQYHDRVTGEKDRVLQTLNVLRQLYPRDFSPANNLAVVQNQLGRYEQAVEAAREANRRNPSHPFPYSNLAYAYRGLNRYDDAVRTADQAVARSIASGPTRRLLYQIALLRGDTAASQRHREWATGTPREFDLVGARAQALAHSGRLRDARDLYAQAMDMARLRNFSEVAAGYGAQHALTEVLYGNPEAARALSETILTDGASSVVGLRLTVVLAMTGQPEAAERLVAEASPYPTSTLIQGVYVPIARAAIALARGDPALALETLRMATPYQLGTVAALGPLYFRGEAHRARADGPAAAAEFQTILDHRGVDPFSCLQPLASLALARARVLAGEDAAARSAYEAVFAIWKDADADLPALREARAEYAQLDE